MNKNGLYLHIPFCKTKCHYCDFYSVSETGLRVQWLNAILQELQNESAFLGTERPVLRSIYFGGGTPSQLSREEFEQLFTAISAFYDLTACEEITLEANPDDLTPDYIADLCRLPFNRISIGVQSFVDAELQALNRRHTAASASEAIRACAQQGFENISLDLMYGLPGQTLESFDYSLQQALMLPVQHLSSYSLSWEEGSVLYAKLQSGVLKQADEEFSESCFFLMKELLESAGFEHYELSNFALKGFVSKHNSSYWDGSHYLGVGPGAHSYNGLVRRFNPPSLKRYVEGVLGGLDFRETEDLSDSTRYNDFIITRLRTMQGLDLRELEATYGSDRRAFCLKNASKSMQHGLLERVDEQLKLTRKGLFVSDSVMSDLLDV